MRTLLVFFLALAALSARANPPETPQPATPAKGTPADLSPAQKAAMDQVLDALAVDPQAVLRPVAMWTRQGATPAQALPVEQLGKALLPG